MLYNFMNKIDYHKHFETAEAHCDIPCKIYDPSSAQIAALTILRMVDLINETEENTQQRDSNYFNSMSRFIATKEEYGIKCKEEIRIIWGDYFKTPQFERFPQIHETTHGIMMLASQCKQSVNREKALALMQQVNRFAEIFWATKDVAVKQCICPYPPSVEVVYPAL